LFWFCAEKSNRFQGGGKVANPATAGSQRILLSTTRAEPNTESETAKKLESILI
jgi:hypothetical protein